MNTPMKMRSGTPRGDGRHVYPMSPDKYVICLPDCSISFADFSVVVEACEDAGVQHARINVQSTRHLLQTLLHEKVHSSVGQGGSGRNEAGAKFLHLLKNPAIQWDLVPGDTYPLNEVARLLLTEAGILASQQIVDYRPLLQYGWIRSERFELADEFLPFSRFEMVPYRREILSDGRRTPEPRLS